MPINSINNIWTEDKVAFLRQHYGTMLSREIADHLGISRNSVIGKACRLGLQSTHGITIKPGRPRIAMIMKPKPKPKKPAVPKQYGRVSFEQLEQWHCREIVQDVPVRYCGAEKIDHSSYCRDHHNQNHVVVRHINVEKHYGV